MSDCSACKTNVRFRVDRYTLVCYNLLHRMVPKSFTKGKHAFIVATHTDKAHIHNHIIFNSTTIDGSKKFHNFFLSYLAVQKISDGITTYEELSAKAAFDQLENTDTVTGANGKQRSRIPSVKELNREYAEVLSGKKKAYSEYRTDRREMQDLLVARKTIDTILDIDRDKDLEKDRRIQNNL